MEEGFEFNDGEMDFLKQVNSTANEDANKLEETQSNNQEEQAQQEVEAKDNVNNEEVEENIDSDPRAETQQTSSSLNSFAAALGEEGIIEYDEEEFNKFENKPEYFRTVLNRTIEKKEFADLDEDTASLVRAIRAGANIKDILGNRVESQDFTRYSEEEISTNESIAKDVYVKSLELKGVSKEEAVEIAETMKAADKLNEMALKGKGEIDTHYRKQEELKIEQAQQAKLQAEETYKKTVNDITKYVENQKQYIPGVNISDNEKSEIIKNMTQAYAQDEQGNPISFVQSKRMDDAIGFEFKMNYLARMGFFDKDADFEALTTALKTKASKGLEALLDEDKSFTLGTGRTRNEKPNKNKGLTDSQMRHIMENF